MQRKELRRLERRHSLRKRILAGGTAVLIALGMAVGGTAPAFSTGGGGASTNPNTTEYWQAKYPNAVACYYHESNGGSHGSVVDGAVVLGEYGSDWPGDRWEVLIVKGGSNGGDGNGNMVYELPQAGLKNTYYPPTNPNNGKPFGVSHWIVCKGETPAPEVPKAGNDLDCVTATNYPGRALTNGDHINMDVVQDGKKFQINAQIDRRQSQDPRSESGLVVRVNAPGFSNIVLPITNAQRDSGIFEFEYSTYLTGSWTIEWVQFNSTYFNQDRNSAKFLICGDLPTEELVEPTVDSTPMTCDTDGSYTLDPVEGVVWFVAVTALDGTPADDDFEQVDPGTYPVSTDQTVHVRAEVESDEYGFAPETQTEWAIDFERPGDCAPPPCIPDEFISYTYNNTNNTGVVTVVQPQGYDDQLCAPLYVTAAAWAFDRHDNQWTQTLVVANEINGGTAITEPGTYEYGAPVGCGQGDIYASRTAFPKPSPFLNGPNNPAWPDGVTPWPFVETFLHNMGFDGPNPTYMVTQPGCNALEPVAPDYTAIDKCEQYGSLTLDDSSPYISYIVRDEEGTVVDAADAKEGTFTVTAVAAFPYVLKNYPAGGWVVELGDYRECVEPTFTANPVTDVDCVSNVPYISSQVSVTDPDGTLPAGTPVYMVFAYPGDASQNHEVQIGVLDADGNLVGDDVLWPGAAVDGDGNATDWPGWDFVDGAWVPTAAYEQFGWTRDLTAVTIRVNPEIEVPLSYPGPTEACYGPVEIAPVPVASECDEQQGLGFDLPAITGVTWFVNGEERSGFQPVTVAGDYVVTFEIDADAEGGPFALTPGAEDEFTFSYTAEDLTACDPPVLPVTDAQLAFLAPTCELGQRLDPENYVFDAELAEHVSTTVEGSSYTVVFRILDSAEDAVFDQSPDVTVDGRTVTDEGKTLTFTGTLSGVLTGEECDRVIEVVDPYGVTDTCLEGASYYVRLVEGVEYTITVNGGTPTVVNWSGTNEVRTFSAAPGDVLNITAAATEGFTLAPQPGPLDHTFEVWPEECLPTLPLVEGSVTFTPASCLDSTNWVTLDDVEGVQWLVNGEERDAARWPMPAGTVEVEATALEGFGFGPETQTSWEFTFAAVDDSTCDVDELAMTGASNALVGTGIAALLITLAGMGVVIGRRVRQEA